jgi:hypothetical protein
MFNGDTNLQHTFLQMGSKTGGFDGMLKNFA